MAGPLSISSTRVRRLLFGIAPFSVMGAVVLMTVFGEHGLVRRHELRQEKRSVEARIDSLGAENIALRRRIQILDQTELGQERLAAERLLMARPGATIYRFQE